MAQVMLDLSGLGGVITAAITQSLNAIQNSLNKLANISEAAPHDIAGLREQIMENADILYPILMKKHDGPYSKMRVLTVSNKGSFFALVVYHDLEDQDRRHKILFTGPKAESVGQALELLLGLTHEIVEDNMLLICRAGGKNWLDFGDYGGYASN